MSSPENAPKENRETRRVEFTDRFVKNLKHGENEVRYTDVRTPGLTLSVMPVSTRKPEGSKRWHFRYLFAGKASMLALGEYPTVTLAEAREKAQQAKKDIDQGINPSLKKKAARQAVQSGTTFQTVAEAWLADRTENKWEASHAKRNKERFIGNIFPVIGTKNINDLTLSDFDRAFVPLKRRGALETAQRICAMCIEILNYAARFRYLTDKNIIFDLGQYKKEDLPRPTKGKLATLTEPNEVGELLCRIEESEARQTYPVALGSGLINEDKR